MAIVLGSSKNNALAWEHKKPKAMYRGSCYPTANPDAEDDKGYLFLRGAVCTAATSPGVDQSMFDVGTYENFLLCEIESPKYVLHRLPP